MKTSIGLRLIALSLLPLGMAACTHVRGVVLADRTERPVPNAQFTVGRPDMMVMNRFFGDSYGHFDFYIGGMDETNLYVWTGQGDPTVSVRHIDHTEISDHMILHMHDPNEMPAP